MLPKPEIDGKMFAGPQSRTGEDSTLAWMELLLQPCFTKSFKGLYFVHWLVALFMSKPR